MIPRSCISMLRTAINVPEYLVLQNVTRSPRVAVSGSRLCSAANATGSTEKVESKASEGSENIDVDAKLQEKDKVLAEKESLLKDLQDKYQRSLAENQNVIQRGRKLVDEAKLFGIQSFSKDLLEVKDVLEKATESVPKEELDSNIHLKNLFEGLTLTDLQLQKVFTKNGLEKVDPMGEKFDPHSHEAVFQLNLPDKEDGTVGLVQKIGYKLNGRTLRPALVAVVKNV